MCKDTGRLDRRRTGESAPDAMSHHNYNISGHDSHWPCKAKILHEIRNSERNFRHISNMGDHQSEGCHICLASLSGSPCR